ncbi:hypothetical protein KI387_009817 [Taxus chinensis]|uniref:Reverse transcriptase zinc-binding domain-containing protein n=1 Tax=Taxus chinensis TaxID=29808 RepID=A0AA38FKN9_TAXCH|nr:hypothetical protein KI387_009817 [Taxus chinensis]
MCASDGVKSWISPNLDEIKNNDGALSLFRILSSTPCLDGFSKDNLIWSGLSSGSMMVKDLYNKIYVRLRNIGALRSFPYSTIWIKEGLPKANYFLWLASLGILGSIVASLSINMENVEGLAMGPSCKRRRAQTGEALGDSFMNWMDGKIKNVAMCSWSEKVWMVEESFEEEDEEIDICNKMWKLMLDPNQSIGHRNVFEVAQGLSVANILSNSSGQFILHREHMDLE